MKGPDVTGGNEGLFLLDARTRELVAVGAAIAGNCLPCLRYHFTEARKQGCSLDEIDEAIELAKMVKMVKERPIQDIYRIAMHLIQRDRMSANTK